MKTALLAFALCFALPGKQEQPKPFKKANTIVLHTQEAPGAALVKLASVAKAQGYTVDTLTDTRLTTAARPYEFRRSGIITPALHRFTAVAAPEKAGAAVVLSGSFRVSLRDNQAFEAQMLFSGGQSQDDACFQQAQRIALAYTGAKVGYAVRP